MIHTSSPLLGNVIRRFVRLHWLLASGFWLSGPVTLTLFLIGHLLFVDD